MNIELQVISHIVSTGSLDIIHRKGIKPDYFLAHQQELNFLLDHHKRYGNVPDKMTFVRKFKDFPMVEVRESVTFLADAMRDAVLYRNLVPLAQKFNEGCKIDCSKATTEFMANIADLQKSLVVGDGVGVDIVKHAKDRHTSYLERMALDGMVGIPSGIKELDDATYGWIKEDHVILLARTNEGKSWIGEYLAIQAWKSGKKVMFYAGEMSAEAMGVRFDTLYANISNTAILRGNADIVDTYKEHLDSLEGMSGLIVVTQEDFGNRKPTIREIQEKADAQDIDIVFLDQLSMLDDERSTDNKTVRYGNISQDTVMACKKRPYITIVQANREANKTKDKFPDIDHIEYCDAVGHDATRVLAMKYEDGLLTLRLQKNRLGSKNVEVMLKWNIDIGLIEPLLSEDELEVMGEEYGF